MKQEARKNVRSNAIFNIIKQASNIIIPLLSYPYVLRVLGEDALGKYSFADSIISYFMIIAALGISTYAIREGARIRDDKEAVTKFSAELFSINLLTTLISYSLLFFIVLFQERLQQVQYLLIILSVNIITNTLARDWINNIYEDYFYITIRYILFQVIALLLIFLFVKSSKDYHIYASIMMFSNSGAYLTSFLYTRKRVPIKVTRNINLRKHIKPIFLLFCSTLAIHIYVKSDITILGYIRTDAEVGVYTAASKIYTIVKALLNAVIMVAIPRLSYYIGKNNLKSYNSLLGKLRDSLIVLVIPCVIGVLFLSREIISLIGGESYETGYVSLSILCGALLFAVFGCFFAQGILIANRDEKTVMIVTFISAVINVLLNILIIPYMGINGAASTTVIAEAVICIVCMIRAKRYTNIKEAASFSSVIIGCFAIVGVCLLCKATIESLLLRTIITVIFSIIVYFAILLVFKNRLVWDLYRYIKEKGKKKLHYE